MSNLYWRRIQPGQYISMGLSPRVYEVGKTASGEWFYEGPGLEGITETKTVAQAMCQKHENERDTP